MVTPDIKIAMTVVAGAIVATIATALAQLGGSDPWGALMPLLRLACACAPRSPLRASCALQSAECNALASLPAEQQGWQSWMRHCSLQWVWRWHSLAALRYAQCCVASARQSVLALAACTVQLFLCYFSHRSLLRADPSKEPDVFESVSYQHCRLFQFKVMLSCFQLCRWGQLEPPECAGSAGGRSGIIAPHRAACSAVVRARKADIPSTAGEAPVAAPGMLLARDGDHADWAHRASLAKKLCCMGAASPGT